MMSGDRPDGLKARLAIAAYAAATATLQPLLPFVLRRRLARGKEDPQRWQEKLGQATAARPDGRLIWMHAVGLGETLALRGVIAALQARLPGVQFLVTSSTRASAVVLAQNAPPATIHQFLPLDTPRNVRRFLHHWRPDMSIWAEQDLWPGFVVETAKRGIPLALINARMNDASFAKRQKWAALYKPLLARFALVSAQDDHTAGHLKRLGAKDVSVAGMLKASAPPLECDAAQLKALQAELAGRLVWVAASTHPADEAVVLAAQRRLIKTHPNAQLVIIPRHPDRAAEVPTDDTVRVIAEFGTLGLWYRLAHAAYIGGTNSDVEGHNPWEAATLGCPVFHGPRYANFAADFPALQATGGARHVSDQKALADALSHPATLERQGHAAQAAVKMHRAALDDLFDRLAGMLP